MIFLSICLSILDPKAGRFTNINVHVADKNGWGCFFVTILIERYLGLLVAVLACLGDVLHTCITMRSVFVFRYSIYWFNSQSTGCTVVNKQRLRSGYATMPSPHIARTL